MKFLGLPQTLNIILFFIFTPLLSAQTTIRGEVQDAGTGEGLINASVVHIVLRTAAVTLGIVMLGAGLIGFLRAPALAWERGALLLGAVLLIFPGAVGDVIGAACLAAVWIAQRARAAVSQPSRAL